MCAGAAGMEGGGMSPTCAPSPPPPLPNAQVGYLLMYSLCAPCIPHCIPHDLPAPPAS